MVLLGGGDDVRTTIDRLLDEGASVVFVDRTEVLPNVVVDLADRHDRSRVAVIAGDPASTEARDAALELAAEHYAAESPEVVVFSQGLDPTVK